MVGMLRSTVTLSVVVVLGALTGLMCERVGVINIGIEGQLLASAFAAIVLSSAFGTLVGIVGGLLIGGLLGLFLGPEGSWATSNRLGKVSSPTSPSTPTVSFI